MAVHLVGMAVHLVGIEGVLDSNSLIWGDGHILLSTCNKKWEEVLQKVVKKAKILCYDISLKN